MSTPPPSSREVNLYSVISLLGAFVFAPVGIVFGAIALRQIKRSGERGRELALVGLWVGIAITVFAVLILIFSVGIVAWSLWFVSDLSQVSG